MAEIRDPWDFGYLQLPKSLVAEEGIVVASVYARIASYCEMEKHECFVSQENIANELGLSRATVNSHIKRLVSLGYVRDLGTDPTHTGRIRHYGVLTWLEHKAAKGTTVKCFDSDSQPI